MNRDLAANLEETKEHIRHYTQSAPKIGIILGSGLGHVAESVTDPVGMFYNDIPHFVASTVQGHIGKLIFGTLSKHDVMVMQGRLHFYEGYSMQEITYPVKVMQSLGVRFLIVTAAVGAMNPAYKRGDLVFIKDHINLMGENPLRGESYMDLVKRFPDMSKVYAQELRTLALSLAKKSSIPAHEGVYVALRGPCYETPAEINAFRKLGGDVVGMSVVPESIVAHQLGMEILGITFISNLAAGVSKTPLSHDEVMAVGSMVNQKLGALISGIVASLP